MNLWMPGQERTPRTEGLKIIQRDAVARQEQLDVQRQRRVSTRQDETIATEPGRVGWIMGQESLEQQICRWSQTHGGARMPISNLLDGVCSEQSGGIDRPVVVGGPP
jgi:type II secretory pathway component PulJ